MTLGPWGEVSVEAWPRCTLPHLEGADRAMSGSPHSLEGERFHI